MPSTDRSADRQLGLLWGAVASALLLLSPLGARLAQALPGCPFKAITGWPCPGCGSTRSALALAHLDLGAALAVSPLATLAWVALIGGGLIAGGLALAGRPLREPRGSVPRWLRWAVMLGIAVNWAYLLAHGT